MNKGALGKIVGSVDFPQLLYIKWRTLLAEGRLGERHGIR